MKAFVIALVVILLTLGLCAANDIYCTSVCNEIMRKANTSSCEEVKNAFELFRKNELLLRASCDAEYVTEAHISLDKLALACENGDEYETNVCKKEATEHIKRIKNALFI